MIGCDDECRNVVNNRLYTGLTLAELVIDTERKRVDVEKRVTSTFKHCIYRFAFYVSSVISWLDVKSNFE